MDQAVVASQVFRYGIAVVAVVVATIFRALADPLLGSNLPLPTFLIGVAASVWYVGEGPALLATFLGYGAINLFFTDPRGTLALQTTADVVLLALYLITCFLFISFGQGVRRARMRAETARTEAFAMHGQLRELEERLHAPQQAARWGLFDYDLISGRLYWTPEIEALYGLQSGQFEKAYGDWIRRIHLADRPEVEAEIERALSSDRLWQDFRVVWPNGSVHWLILRAKIMRDDQGRPLRMLGANADITDHKNAEDALVEAAARLRAIVDTAVDGIITIDERGIVDSANAAVERIFGYPPEEVVGRSVSVLMPEPYRSQHESDLANYLRTGARKIVGIGREVRGRRRDGSEFPLELAVSETRLAGRRLFTGIVRDVTERHTAHEALKLADRRKDEILGSARARAAQPAGPNHYRVARNAAARVADPGTGRD